MATEWFDSFINSLERLLDKPPYLIFVFIGAVFMVISLITQNNLQQSQIFLIYAVGGTIWRYGERDFLRASGENTVPILGKAVKWRLITHIVYHIGNLGLFIALLYYLRFI